MHNARGERIGSVISLTDLGYPKPSWDTARRLVSELNKGAALIVLGQFNLFLAVASIQAHESGNLNRRRFAQERILANIISEKRLAEIRFRVGNADLLDRPLVHRSVVMAALRLVASHALPIGGNRLEARDEFDILGELFLVLNAVTEPEPSKLTPCDIAAQISPSREVENHPQLGSTLVRVSRMLDIHLKARERLGLPPVEIARRAEQVFTFATDGFNFQTFRDLTLFVFAFNSQLELHQVLRDPGRTYLNPKSPGSPIPADVLDRFLSQLAVRFEDVAEHLATTVLDHRLLSDFTVFRQKPFWKFEDGGFLCLDPGFLMDKLAEGTFWWIMEGLGSESEPEGKDRRRQFSALWGYVFEDYVDEQLSYAYFGREEKLRLHPHYVRPNEEAFDSIVVDGSEMVVVQCKSAFLPAAARYSASCERFYAGLDHLFGLEAGAAGEQLIRNIQFIVGEGAGRREILDTPLHDVQVVFPLAIVQESALGFWLTAKLLIDAFSRRLEGARWNGCVEVRPLVFVTVDELEDVVEYVRAGDFSLAQLLGAKLEQDPHHQLSIDQFLHRFYRPSRQIARRRNEFMAVELGAFKTQWPERMKARLG